MKKVEGYYDNDGNWVPGYTLITCCGKKLKCKGMTTTCSRCHADYNWNGEKLVDRSLWGVDTGEVF